jgi:hypothetical protein
MLTVEYRSQIGPPYYENLPAEVQRYISLLEHEATQKSGTPQKAARFSVPQPPVQSFGGTQNGAHYSVEHDAVPYGPRSVAPVSNPPTQSIYRPTNETKSYSPIPPPPLLPAGFELPPDFPDEFVS